MFLFRFGKSVRIISSLCFTLQMVVYMAIVVYAPALALAQVYMAIVVYAPALALAQVYMDI